MLHKIESFEKELREYHDEMAGNSFATNNTIQHYANYTGAALDALSDLKGIIEMGKGERDEH